MIDNHTNQPVQLRTMAEDREEMKFFKQVITENEQVNNLLGSCSKWLETCANMFVFRNYAHLMKEYGFKINDIKAAYNRLHDENAALKKRVAELEAMFHG